MAVPGIGFSQNFSIAGGTTTSILLPSNVDLVASDTITNQGVRVTSDVEVAVYGLNQRSFTTDAYMGLPVDTLGTDYFAMSYVNGGPQLALNQAKLDRENM